MSVEAMWVGLDSWIIQDGNYGEFQVGREESFALEFFPHVLAPASSRTGCLRWLKRDCYEFCAQVTYRSGDVWVIEIDSKIQVYQHAKPPPQAQTGFWLAGELSLSVDPFDYFERLAKLPEMPALIYPWRINRILLETTPWLSRLQPSGQPMRWRDTTSEAFTEVAETDAWNDDEGRGFYLLECTRFGSASSTRT